MLSSIARRMPAAVSIHAPRCRGAMPAPPLNRRRRHTRFNPRPPLPGSDASKPRRPAWSRWGFNPRPPLPGSDAGGASRVGYGALVSIHAPRCRGAMPLPLLCGSFVNQFQSTPPVAGERCHLAARLANAEKRFQSTPPVAGERCVYPGAAFKAVTCFNPRPPLPGSDARRRYLVR